MIQIAKNAKRIVVVSLTCALITSCAKNNITPKNEQPHLHPPNKSLISVTEDNAGQFKGILIHKTADFELRNNQHVHFFMVKAFDRNGDSVSTDDVSIVLLFKNRDRPPTSLDCKQVQEIPEGRVVNGGKEIDVKNMGRGRFKLKFKKSKHKKDKTCYQYEIHFMLKGQKVAIDPWIRIRRNQNN